MKSTHITCEVIYYIYVIILSHCRDFGYVARDTLTKKYQCHVFRCGMPARAIARALLVSRQKEIGITAKEGNMAAEREKCQVFVVQYLGCQEVSKCEGLDVVLEVIKQLALPIAKAASVSSLHLIDFEVSQSGISLIDHQRESFSKKLFPVKDVTYVVRIKLVCMSCLLISFIILQYLQKIFCLHCQGQDWPWSPMVLPCLSGT